ncbi:MAG: hypothetical protein A2017_12790 [Lentisphaerae bacterium GWF2_44_16]|nr:MAG: hypothetical protein A2017_12790 [Lentisphaerae bacterium GWF2_44_16]
METNEKCLGCDGSEWLLEALQNGNYHYIDRWTPTYDSEKRNAVDFINLCTWLYRKAPIKSDLTNKGDIEIKK